MPKVYFVRHGQSQANVDGVIAGWQDSPLTDLGMQQAQNEAQAIYSTGMQFDRILTSPLSRAYETAKIIAHAIQYPVVNIIVLDDLREKYGGDFEGKRIALLEVASAEEVTGAGAESFEEFAERVQRANVQIAQYVTGATLVVGHSGFYRMAQAVARHIPPSDMAKITRPDNGKLLEYPLK